MVIGKNPEEAHMFLFSLLVVGTSHLCPQARCIDR